MNSNCIYKNNDLKFRSAATVIDTVTVIRIKFLEAYLGSWQNSIMVLIAKIVYS